MNHDEVIEAKKYNFWRGFRSALFVSGPIIAALMWQLNKCITLLVG